MEFDPLSKKVIGLAIEVHREIGPGLLEGVYEECFCHELRHHGLTFARQQPVPLIYKSVKLDCGYRLDVVVENELIVELKAVEKLTSLHDAQLLTYLRLTGLKTGLLFNFNTPVLRNGLRRLVL